MLPKVTIDISNLEDFKIKYENGDVKNYKIVGFRHINDRKIILAARPEHFSEIEKNQSDYFVNGAGNPTDVLYGIPDSQGEKGVVIKASPNMRTRF